VPASSRSRCLQLAGGYIVGTTDRRTRGVVELDLKDRVVVRLSTPGPTERMVGGLSVQERLRVGLAVSPPPGRPVAAGTTLCDVAAQPIRADLLHARP
jgi:hypothetical protein